MVNEIFSWNTKEFLKNDKGKFYLSEPNRESTIENEEIDTTDMPELESEESAAKRQSTEGHGLKIITPNQMLNRFPVSLAQLNAGNNSKKLKNEIRQLLYSLYRSKKLTKQVYKSLNDII